jgi:hypothetical protein
MKLNLGALPKAKIQFIEPMYARLVSELPDSKEWLYEVKFVEQDRFFSPFS